MNVNMNVNKKLGRFKQWAGERMGGEVKTDTSDDFKSLEVEMGLRQNGFEKMQKSMAAYVKSLSKRNEGDDKEKSLPVANLGFIMVKHGEDFEDDNVFGKCLQGLGSTNERIGRIQETYVQDASTSWLDSLERSNVQMKEYNAARKKLESRRLAYDTAVAKMDKLKKDDFRVEEEHRSAKEKYEYSVIEVRQRMDDIKEAEADSVADLHSFLDAELKYHDRCKEALMLLKDKWPQTTPQEEAYSRKNSRHDDDYEDEFAAPKPVARPTIRATRTASNNFALDNGARPGAQRASTFEGPRQLHRDVSPLVSQPISRVPSDNVVVQSQRDRLRPMTNRTENQDVFGDGSDSSAYYDSPERSYKERSASPATSFGSVMSRNASYSNLNPARNGKKVPPPPPPPRSKKPPPPPPSNHKPLLY